MTISDEQVAHDLAIAYVTAKLSKQNDVRVDNHAYVDYKTAFEEYKQSIINQHESDAFLAHNYPRKN